MARSPARTNFELLGLAWSLGWRIAAGVTLGYLLDTRLGCAPLLTLLFAISALVVGVVQLIRAIEPDDEDGA